MNFLIVTGMSGSGKSTTMNFLEDIGYYCVDNLPAELITKFADICMQSQPRFDLVAIAVDIRGGESFFSILHELEDLRSQGIPIKILYLDATDETLLKRYKETRRKHPLDDGTHGGLGSVIRLERDYLMPLKCVADYQIDTTYISGSELREQIASIFLEHSTDAMIVKVMSFGFKYGLPSEADLVFDVRCLPNPFYIPQLKPLFGNDKPVDDYVMSFAQSRELLDKLTDLVHFLIPLYVHEGKSQLIIAIGCTGGKHRSVAFTEHMEAFLKNEGLNVRKQHRDISKDVD